MNKKIQMSILSIFIAAALIGSVATFGANMAFAGGIITMVTNTRINLMTQHKKSVKIQKQSNIQDVVLVTIQLHHVTT